LWLGRGKNIFKKEKKMGLHIADLGSAAATEALALCHYF
jgi:hypothetical protein